MLESSFPWLVELPKNATEFAAVVRDYWEDVMAIPMSWSRMDPPLNYQNGPMQRHLLVMLPQV